jgi:hypothetical protein
MRCARERAVLDAGPADRPLEPQRLGYGGEGGVVALPIPLELLRDPHRAGVQADDARPDAVLYVLVHEEEAGLLRAARPLVHGAGIEVGTHLGQVDVENAERLRAVDEREHAVLSRRAAEFRGREQVTRVAAHVGECEHLRSRRERLRERVDEVLGAWMRVHHRHRDDREAEALCLVAPCGEVARMVVVPDDHLIARPELEAARDPVVSLAGVARDDDLFGRDAQRLGEKLPCLLALAREARSHGGAGERLVVARVLLERLDDRKRRRAEVGGVDEAQVRRDEESRTHVAPELFIRLRRRGRERRGREAEDAERDSALREGAGGEECGSAGEREESGEVAAREFCVAGHGTAGRVQ